MTDQPTVLVIIPAWNEQAAIAAVIREVQKQPEVSRIVVVDDGSTDATARVAADAGAEVLRLPYNLGVGGAMRLGYRYAKDCNADVAIQIDGDGQHDPTAIPAMLAALAGADIVIGARFAGTGDYDVRGARRWAMRMLAAVLSRITHAPLTDVTSGFRATNRRGIDLFATRYPVEYLGDTVESLVMAARAQLRITQLPVLMRPRQGGSPSQPPLKASLYLLRAVLALLLALTRRREPPVPG
jgi:glycosyltransferase involved in cell wall biosynthesis